MRRMALSLVCLPLLACGGWPDLGAPTLERSKRDWPDLLPLSQLVAEGGIEAASDEDARRLAARAAALRSRAQILRTDAGDADAMEALRARLRR